MKMWIRIINFKKCSMIDTHVLLLTWNARELIARHVDFARNLKAESVTENLKTSEKVES